MIYKSLSKSHLAAALESTRDIGEISARLPHKFQMFPMMHEEENNKRGKSALPIETAQRDGMTQNVG